MTLSGHHIASRLVELGVSHYYCVPGDFNLVLLDQLLEEPRLTYVGCCNELNAGYAADGHVRSGRGRLGVVVTTFMVGGLSALNAVAGAFAEDLPLLVISGGPNSHDLSSNRILHHTTGERGSYDQQLRCYETVTCAQAVITGLEDAHEKIDYAISEAISKSKPAYLQIACNLAGVPHASFAHQPVPYAISPKVSNQVSLQSAVEAAAEVLNNAVKPVLLAGPRLRDAKAIDAFVKLADASGYAVAVSPSAKGLIDETHASYMGVYWGQVSSPCCCEIVESSDLQIFCGPRFSDYESVGYTTLLKDDQMIRVDPYRVTICGRVSFGCVLMCDFLSKLSEVLDHNPFSIRAYEKLVIPEGVPSEAKDDDLILNKNLQARLQRLVTPQTAVLVESGDAWFIGQKLHLARGATYHMQMMYGSIGWSVGATLGLSLATADAGSRVLALIGDGSFQVSAQELSTMARQKSNAIVVLLNNSGYTIEASHLRI